MASGTTEARIHEATALDRAIETAEARGASRGPFKLNEDLVNAIAASPKADEAIA